MTDEQTPPSEIVAIDPWMKNAAGVKDGAACYRTIAGVRWLWWSEDAAIFKGTGVRHRAAPDCQGTFIHPSDDQLAQEVVYSAAHGSGSGKR